MSKIMPFILSETMELNWLVVVVVVVILLLEIGSNDDMDSSSKSSLEIYIYQSSHVKTHRKATLETKHMEGSIYGTEG